MFFPHVVVFTPSLSLRYSDTCPIYTTIKSPQWDELRSSGNPEEDYDYNKNSSLRKMEAEKQEAKNLVIILKKIQSKLSKKINRHLF